MKNVLIVCFVALFAACFAVTAAERNRAAEYSHNNAVVTGIAWSGSSLITIRAEIPGFGQPNITPAAAVGTQQIACGAYHRYSPESWPHHKKYVELDCEGSNVLPYDKQRTRVCIYIEEAFNPEQPPTINQLLSSKRCMILGDRPEETP